MNHKLQIRKAEWVTHDVIRLLTDKPRGYEFTPGQATELAIDKEGWRTKGRPFTFTSLPGEDELEFTIKIYESHDGVTEEIAKLGAGDTVLIGDAWGAIQYKGTGTFIAGGAGITPFIAILKHLNQEDDIDGNRLLFANKTEKDIIYKNNLETWLGNDFHNILSREEKDGYDHGYINGKVLKEKQLDTAKPVYLCGPPPMMEALQPELFAMGISKDQLVMEGME